MLVFSGQYNGMFFDEKTAGIELIHHGVRTATGGAVRLKPTPEQWDQVPKVVERKVDKAANTIEVLLRYDAFDFDSRVVVKPEGRAGSDAATIMHLVDTRERFKPVRDETLVDQPGRFVDIHRPDGKPDLLQQIEHGALQLLAATKERQYADRFHELIWPALDRSLARNMSVAVKAAPHLDAAFKAKLVPYVRKHKNEMDAPSAQNPYGVPIGTGGWAGNDGVISWAVTNYHLHEAYPALLGPEYVLRGLTDILGTHPASNVPFVSGVGTRSKMVAYGSNRADYTFIAGGVVPGVLVLKPDFPENKEDWPFLWGEDECVIDICANCIFLANAANDLLGK